MLKKILFCALSAMTIGLNAAPKRARPQNQSKYIYFRVENNQMTKVTENADFRVKTSDSSVQKKHEKKWDDCTDYIYHNGTLLSSADYAVAQKAEEARLSKENAKKAQKLAGNQAPAAATPAGDTTTDHSQPKQASSEEVRDTQEQAKEAKKVKPVKKEEPKVEEGQTGNGDTPTNPTEQNNPQTPTKKNNNKLFFGAGAFMIVAPFLGYGYYRFCRKNTFKQD